VAAAEALDMAACVTVVSLDASKAIIDQEEVWTGFNVAPGPRSTDDPLPGGTVLFRVNAGPTAQCTEYGEGGWAGEGAKWLGCAAARQAEQAAREVCRLAS
jgi:hypothetical protein